MPKGKGSAFEREISKLLGLWWTEGERDDVIWRTQNSGGRATVRRKVGKTTAGQSSDLTFTDPIAKPLFDHCTIECKRGYKWSLLDLVDKPKQSASQMMEKWIDQVEKDREASFVSWALIIAKRDKRLPVIIIPNELFNRIWDYYGKRPKIRLRFGCRGVRWVLRLDHFLDWAEPQFFTEVL